MQALARVQRGPQHNQYKLSSRQFLPGQHALLLPCPLTWAGASPPNTFHPAPALLSILRCGLSRSHALTYETQNVSCAGQLNRKTLHMKLRVHLDTPRTSKSFCSKTLKILEVWLTARKACARRKYVSPILLEGDERRFLIHEALGVCLQVFWL